MLLLRRYRLGEQLAAGGEATVWRAYDEQLGRDVAVKIFRSDAYTQEQIEEQEREVRLLASLDHHGLAALLDAGVGLAGGAPRVYLVMSLVDGDDLQSLVDAGPLTSRQTAYVGHDLAEALEYIHFRGVVHRDVKPSNVLLTNYTGEDSRRRAKLVDFGIARLMDTLRTGEVTKGTAAFLSPEQALGRRVDGSSDIYSLGLVLLQCLTGEVAFPGTPFESAKARIVGDPPIPDHVSDDWRLLLRAMTARDPSARPTPAEVIAATRDIVIGDIGRRRAVRPELVPVDEPERMSEVRRLGILDTAPEEAFDRITALAARTLDVPIALVTVIDDDRAWFKSNIGLEFREVPRDVAFCSWAVLEHHPLVVSDATADPRMSGNPLVTADPSVRFYAGVPLTMRSGRNVGALCVFDREPRTLDDDELATLTDLAGVVVTELELRLAGRVAAEQRDALLAEGGPVRPPL